MRSLTREPPYYILTTAHDRPYTELHYSSEIIVRNRGMNFQRIFGSAVLPYFEIRSIGRPRFLVYDAELQRARKRGFSAHEEEVVRVRL